MTRLEIYAAANKSTSFVQYLRTIANAQGAILTLFRPAALTESIVQHVDTSRKSRIGLSRVVGLVACGSAIESKLFHASLGRFTLDCRLSKQANVLILGSIPKQHTVTNIWSHSVSQWIDLNIPSRIEGAAVAIVATSTGHVRALDVIMQTILRRPSCITVFSDDETYSNNVNLRRSAVKYGVTLMFNGVQPQYVPNVKFDTVLLTGSSSCGNKFSADWVNRDNTAVIDMVSNPRMGFYSGNVNPFTAIGCVPTRIQTPISWHMAVAAWNVLTSSSVDDTLDSMRMHLDRIY